ncbi:MAG: glutamine-hydrolyzing carbamoyl-phosphate synthase small subunit [Gammaproteobacteria bacterium]|nr:glutamine-hydrolyzing carbamoyl-phosphate synthase small subunit [Gammaproteobacteria bacterium]MCW5583616.1 glutamine-hydrolyzing carbamoyl-phosphate synthase small subunit [Gammaproteobacteria bacterium]
MSLTAQLVLKSGEVFDGEAPDDQERISFGEVVFTTGMVGYVEALTDPSYAGQILVFTYPLIGNYGVSGSDTWESHKIHVRGAIFSELSPYYSNHSAHFSLKQWLTEQRIPYMTKVDTRALTKCLRTKGVVSGAIVPLGTKFSDFEDFNEVNWVREVSIKEPQYYGAGDKLIIVVDCGMKENILRSFMRFPVRIKRVPYDYDFTHEEFDGVFISNGPGDPIQCQKTITILRKAMAQHKPTFGICLGTQLMALAAEAKTYKLPFGHRSHNQPCLHLATNRCYLTSQNHGYAVDETSLSSDWRVTFRNLNDQSVAGIEHHSLPFFSVQFHPEAAPGPEDTQWLFQKFFDWIKQKS